MSCINFLLNNNHTSPQWYLALLNPCKNDKLYLPAKLPVISHTWQCYQEATLSSAPWASLKSGCYVGLYLCYPPWTLIVKGSNFTSCLLSEEIVKVIFIVLREQNLFPSKQVTSIALIKRTYPAFSEAGWSRSLSVSSRFNPVCCQLKLALFNLL